MREMLSSNRH